VVSGDRPDGYGLVRPVAGGELQHRRRSRHGQLDGSRSRLFEETGRIVLFSGSRFTRRRYRIRSQGVAADTHHGGGCAGNGTSRLTFRRPCSWLFRLAGRSCRATAHSLGVFASRVAQNPCRGTLEVVPTNPCGIYPLDIGYWPGDAYPLLSSCEPGSTLRDALRRLPPSALSSLRMGVARPDTRGSLREPNAMIAERSATIPPASIVRADPKTIEPCIANERRATNGSPAHRGPVHVGRSLAMQRSISLDRARVSSRFLGPRGRRPSTPSAFGLASKPSRQERDFPRSRRALGYVRNDCAKVNR